MNKVAVLAGVSATLGVLLVDAVIKNRQLIARVQKNDGITQEKLEWYKIRYHLTTEELNFAYSKLDQFDRAAVKKLYENNESYLSAIAATLHPHFGA